MSPQERFVLRVDEVLHYIWDPLDVAGIPAVRDEYRGYVAQSVKLARTNGEQALISYFHQVETRTMGVTGDPNKCAEVAAIIMNWKQDLLDQVLETN